MSKAKVDWTYSFAETSKSDWFRQIEADLKNRSVDSLSSTWWEDEPIIPIVHPEDLPKEPVRLPDAFFSGPPKLIEWIECKDKTDAAINIQVLSALKQGAQSIIFSLPKNAQQFNAGWLEGVQTEIIEISIAYDQSKDQIQNLPANTRIRINRNGSDTTNIVQLNSSQFRLVYRIQGHGAWTNEVISVLTQLLKDLDHLETAGLAPAEALNKCILAFHPDSDYFKSVIQHRTLHIVWQNLLAHYQIADSNEGKKCLETHVIQQPDEKPDHFLIKSAALSLAACLSGTSGLCIHPLTGNENQGMYSRIHRNVHHLLNYESGLYRGTDPLGGAYAIDLPTRRWVENIWQGIKPML